MSMITTDLLDDHMPHIDAQGRLHYETVWEKRLVARGVDVRLLFSCIEDNIYVDSGDTTEQIDWNKVVADYNQVMSERLVRPKQERA